MVKGGKEKLVRKRRGKMSFGRETRVREGKGGVMFTTLVKEGDSSEAR